jgi:hypothetical protein
MKALYKFAIVSIVIVSMLFVVIVPRVFAITNETQDASPSGTPKVREKPEDKKGKNLNTANQGKLFCQRVESNIKMRSARKVAWDKKYTNIKSFIQKRIDKYSALGLNTDKLKADQSTLDGLVQTLNQDYATAFSAANAYKDTLCTTTSAPEPSQVKAKLESIFSPIKTDMQKIVEFIRKTIIPDITALLNQIKTTKPKASKPPKPSVLPSASPIASPTLIPTPAPTAAE